jgi:hypothetical protein
MRTRETLLDYSAVLPALAPPPFEGLPLDVLDFNKDL